MGGRAAPQGNCCLTPACVREASQFLPLCSDPVDPGDQEAEKCHLQGPVPGDAEPGGAWRGSRGWTGSGPAWPVSSTQQWLGPSAGQLHLPRMVLWGPRPTAPVSAQCPFLPRPLVDSSPTEPLLSEEAARSRPQTRPSSPCWRPGGAWLSAQLVSGWTQSHRDRIRFRKPRAQWGARAPGSCWELGQEGDAASAGCRREAPGGSGEVGSGQSRSWSHIMRGSTGLTSGLGHLLRPLTRGTRQSSLMSQGPAAV